MCQGVNDAPFVFSRTLVINAEKNVAVKLEIADVDSPLMFIALAEMPKKMKIYQTDDVASTSLDLVSLKAHSTFGVGWVAAEVSTNGRKCFQNCRSQSIVGPLQISDSRPGLDLAIEKVLSGADNFEVTVEFEYRFYAKTFDIFAEIPEGISLSISASQIIDGMEIEDQIWQGYPKPVAHENSSFIYYGKQRVLKKKMWTIDVCPSWVFTSTYKFLFDKPIGVQLVSISAIYAYAYDHPVAGSCFLKSYYQLKI
jgi:hypothetical protein